MSRVPYVLTYSHQLPNIKEAINKHWDILKINPQLETIFTDKPILAFRRNKNLRDILGQKTILNGKVKRNIPINERKGWCQQVRNTNTFKSNKTKEEFKTKTNSYIIHTISVNIP